MRQNVEHSPTFTAFTPDELMSLMRRACEYALQHTRTPEPETQPYISVKEAARLCGLSTVSIYAHIKTGALTKHKIGTQTRLERSQVLSLIQTVK